MQKCNSKVFSMAVIIAEFPKKSCYLENMEGSDLDAIVLAYMKSKRYRRSTTLLEKSLESRQKTSLTKFPDLFGIIQRFHAYLVEKENKRANQSDDLGFEINFGAIQTTTKVSIVNFG